MFSSFVERADALQRRLPWWVITLSLLAAMIAVNLIVSYFDLAEEDAPLDIPNMWLMLGVSVVVAPLLETLFFQCGIIELSVRLLRFMPMRSRYATGMVVSALLFGSSHWNYLVLMSVIGFAFALNYAIFRRRGGAWCAFGMTFLLHAVYNAIACIGDLI